MAELDAAYFLLYGLSRDEAANVLSTFSGAAEPDESTPSMFRTDNLGLPASTDCRAAVDRAIILQNLALTRLSCARILRLMARLEDRS